MIMAEYRESEKQLNLCDFCDESRFEPFGIWHVTVILSDAQLHLPFVNSCEINL